MFRRKLCAGSAALTCLAAFQIANAAPTFQVLYHERLEIAPRVDSKGQQHLGFDAYGRHFDLALEPNETIRRAVPAGRPDIKPYRGTVAGRAGSWVRLTQNSDGWRGVLSDGRDLYAIESSSQLQKAGVPSVTADGAAPVMYRLADALIPDGAAFCGTGTDENFAPPASASQSGTSRPTALTAYTAIGRHLSMKDTSGVTTRQLVVSVIADHPFTDSYSDPTGEIISRMDVVDGIWSSQVGIQVALGTVDVLTDADDTFSATTVPADLLAEVARYRGALPGSDGSGLTHLMSGRALDGNIIGIAYVGAVCDGTDSVSLSDTTASTTMGALVAAHELGHNFNAPHDGVVGACASTPQTYLMAPTINFSNQFSSCSITQITTRAASASCVVTTANNSGSSSPGSTASHGTPTGGGTVSDPSGSGSTPASGSGGGGSLDLTWLAFLLFMRCAQLSCGSKATSRNLAALEA
jgi:Metallo-peptidase family M12